MCPMKLKTIRDYHLAYRQLDQEPFTQEVKLALLASYTSDFIQPLLQVDLMRSGIRSDLYKPRFNQFRQEILDGNSGLYAAQPDITILSSHLEDVFPIFETDPMDVAQEALSLCESMIRSYRQFATPGSTIHSELDCPDSLLRSTCPDGLC